MTCSECAEPITGQRITCSKGCKIKRDRRLRDNEKVKAYKRRVQNTDAGRAYKRDVYHRPENAARRAAARLSPRMVAARRKAREAARGTVGKKVWRAGPCAVCGAPTVWENPRHATCSDVCRRTSRNRRKAKRWADRRLFVLERDGYVCWLCNLPIDPAFQSPHPLGATVDHVIPIVFGGSHQAENLKAAHHSCNSRRGCAQAA